MYLVKAGYIYVSMYDVSLAEDSHEEPEPRRLPAGVLRVTVRGGRTLDFVGAAADTLRHHLVGLSLRTREAGGEEGLAKAGKQVPVPAC